MTTVAYRDGIIAADTGAARGQTLFDGVCKVSRVSDGTLVGAAGRATFMAAMIRWADSGMHDSQPVAGEDEDAFDVALIVRPSGTIEVHEPGGFYQVDAPYYAIGSGRDQAIGAMFAGADAETAVHAAIRHDAWTNGGVKALTR